MMTIISGQMSNLLMGPSFAVRIPFSIPKNKNKQHTHPSVSFFFHSLYSFTIILLSYCSSSTSSSSSFFFQSHIAFLLWRRFLKPPTSLRCSAAATAGTRLDPSLKRGYRSRDLWNSWIWIRSWLDVLEGVRRCLELRVPPLKWSIVEFLRKKKEQRRRRRVGPWELVSSAVVLPPSAGFLSIRLDQFLITYR